MMLKKNLILAQHCQYCVVLVPTKLFQIYKYNISYFLNVKIQNVLNEIKNLFSYKYFSRLINVINFYIHISIYLIK